MLRQARPCGVILFARNVADPDQVRRLTDDARAAIGADDILVLIDQEGGRVQRLRPPHWRALPPAAAYGALYARRPAAGAARGAAGRAADGGGSARGSASTPTARRCSTCRSPGSHDIIGDRAYAATIRRRWPRSGARWRRA